MRLFIVFCVTVITFFVAIARANAHLDCSTDTECEDMARALCDAGHIEWCVEEV